MLGSSIRIKCAAGQNVNETISFGKLICFPSREPLSYDILSTSNAALSAVRYASERVIKTPGVHVYSRYCRSGLLEGHTKIFMKNTGSYDQPTRGTLYGPNIPWFWHMYYYPFSVGTLDAPYSTKLALDIKITYYCLFYKRDETLEA